MAVPANHTLKEYRLSCFSPSIASSPTAAYLIVPRSGRIIKTYGVSYGTTTGTTAVAVAINGGSAISSAALSIAAGNAGVEVEANVNATDAAQVQDGDVISFTPSGGTGSTIGGMFTVAINAGAS